MRFRLIGAVAAVVLAAGPGVAMAAPSCFDLWYARNAIYDDAGFCFSTDLGQRTFDNDDCWTKHPKLSAKDQRLVNAIAAEEKRRDCHVN